MTSPEPPRELETIRTPEALANLCLTLEAAGRFALDTEFVGERTYLPRLCLVQIATTEFIALIDTQAVTNLDALWNLVCDPSVEVILHAAREDLRLAFAPEMRHVIVSLMDKENPQVKSFTVRDCQPVEEPVLMEELK